MLATTRPVWSMTLLDRSGTSGTTRGSFAGYSDPAVYMAALAALAGRVQAISNCAVVRYAVSYRSKDSTAGTPTNAPPIAALSRFVFEVGAGAGIYDSIVIPRRDSWVLTAGPLAGYGLDLANADVAAIAAEISAGIYCDPFGDDIGDLFSAYIESIA